MVNLSTYMVATTAMIMGINALDSASAAHIQNALENASILPASASASASAVAAAESNNLHADGIFEHFLEDVDTFFKNVMNPNLEVSDQDAVAPSVKPSAASHAYLASAPASSSRAEASNSAQVLIAEQSVNVEAASNVEQADLRKRAIYNLNGHYAEAVIPVASVGPNAYSALDIASAAPSASAARSASASASAAPSASMKPVLKARRSALESAKASHRAAASASASASAPSSHSISHEMLEYASLVRRALIPDATEAAEESGPQDIFGDILSFLGELFGIGGGSENSAVPAPPADDAAAVEAPADPVAVEAPADAADAVADGAVANDSSAVNPSASVQRASASAAKISANPSLAAASSLRHI